MLNKETVLDFTRKHLGADVEILGFEDKGDYAHVTYADGQDAFFINVGKKGKHHVELGGGQAGMASEYKTAATEEEIIVNNELTTTTEEELSMTHASKLTKDQLIVLMEQAGMVFSKDLTKKELVAMYNAQNVQTEAAASTETKNPFTEETTTTEEESSMIELTTKTEENVDETTAPETAPEKTAVIEDSFIPEAPIKPETPNDQAPTDTPAAPTVTEENKRKVGKLVEWHNEAGALVDVFPSIKAAASFFKDELKLKHMPFTPIMKSIRQGIDWTVAGTSYSFAFASVDRSVQPEAETQPAVNEDGAPIENIIEEPIEEIIDETTKTEEQSA